MSTSSQHAYLAAVRADPGVFFYQAFNTVYPGKQLMWNWHIEAIVHCLEQCLQGKMPRLIINLPPRHLKSFLVSVAWPAFVLGLDPSAKLICVSYSDDLARTLSRDFKRTIESDWYRKLFPHVRFTKVTESEIVTDKGGFRYATSVGGTLTGRGADWIIIDDPTKPEDAVSDKARQAVNDWYRSTLLTRLDDKQLSVLILVMQRLHVNDLTGYVEAAGGYHKLSFAAIGTKDEVVPLRHGNQYRRQCGEALHPERESIEVLRRIRDEIGAFNFGSQYQQSPETPDGALFKRKWFKLLDAAPKRHPYGRLYVSIDSALSTANTADYSAISLVYIYEKDFYILSAERGRWDYETLKSKALTYVRRVGNEVSFVIEAAGSGLSLIQFLRSERISCFHYYPKTDKFARACAVVPIVESGRVHIVNIKGNNDWVEPYLNEFVNFPHGRFDDQVDSLVQVLSFGDRRHNSGSRVYVID